MMDLYEASKIGLTNQANYWAKLRIELGILNQEREVLENIRDQVETEVLALDLMINQKKERIEEIKAELPEFKDWAV
jgi:hypothetical protein